jgi:hypothetical protein
MPNSNAKLDITSNNAVFRKINNLYLSSNSVNNDSYYYGTQRQHNMSSSMSTLPSQSALLDKNSFLKFTTYSLNNANTSSDSKVSSITQNNKPLIGSLIDNKNVVGSTNFYKTLTNSVFSNDLNFQNYLINFSKYYTLNLLTDKQDFTNPAKIIDSKKKNSTNSNVNTSFSDEFFSNTRGNFYS